MLDCNISEARWLSTVRVFRSLCAATDVSVVPMEQPRNKRKSIDRIGQHDRRSRRNPFLLFSSARVYISVIHGANVAQEKSIYIAYVVAASCFKASLVATIPNRTGSGGGKRISKRQTAKIIVLLVLESRPMLLPDLGFDSTATRSFEIRVQRYFNNIRFILD